MGATEFDIQLHNFNKSIMTGFILVAQNVPVQKWASGSRKVSFSFSLTCQWNTGVLGATTGKLSNYCVFTRWRKRNRAALATSSALDARPVAREPSLQTVNLRALYSCDRVNMEESLLCLSPILWRPVTDSLCCSWTLKAERSTTRYASALGR